LPAAEAARRKAELLRTLQAVCANLRGLQTSAAMRQLYREVERLLLAHAVAFARPVRSRRARSRARKA
jgi:hypothetical protein